jgi:hypothetical protein
VHNGSLFERGKKKEDKRHQIDEGYKYFQFVNEMRHCHLPIILILHEEIL